MKFNSGGLADLFVRFLLLEQLPEQLVLFRRHFVVRMECLEKSCQVNFRRVFGLIADSVNASVDYDVQHR